MVCLCSVCVVRLNKHSTSGPCVAGSWSVFPGIVCFVSETLLTNSTERLNARGHISIVLLCKLTAGCFTAEIQ